MKIEQDFSNYSAWHYRTVLIPKIHKQRDADYWKRIDSGQSNCADSHRQARCAWWPLLSAAACCIRHSLVFSFTHCALLRR